tara:strand:- start:5923 stop:6957 length:1035 start_codon:yes stop_codon:yes gene_type:complete
MMRVKGRASLNRQAGFSMVELMVALVLGLFLTTAILQTFIGAKDTYEFQNELSRMQENGRFAMTFLSRDIRAADFWGCMGDGDLDTNIVDPVDSLIVGAGSASDFAAGLLGFNNVPVASTGYDPVFGGVNNRPDAIVLQGGRGEGVAVSASAGASLSVTSTTGIQVGDILLASDCTDGVMFQVSSVDSSTQLAHEVNGGSVALTPGNNPDTLGVVFDSSASVFQAAPIRYWIRTGASGEPALIRGTQTDAWSGGDELVDGVENIQFLFGEDVNDDGTADYFVDADNVVNMNQVVSIQVHLVVRSLRDNMVDPAPINYYGGPKSANDGRMRKVFVSTIALRNRLD